MENNNGVDVGYVNEMLAQYAIDYIEYQDEYSILLAKKKELEERMKSIREIVLTTVRNSNGKIVLSDIIKNKKGE